MEPTPDVYSLEALPNLLLHLAIPLILFLLGWLLKQNRDAKITMGLAITTLTDAVNSVQKELQHYRETWIDRREHLLEIINTQFTQAQANCREVTDLQLAGLKEGQLLVCTKIDDLKKDRVVKWEGQDKLNTKLLTHMADSKLHNKGL